LTRFSLHLQRSCASSIGEAQTGQLGSYEGGSQLDQRICNSVCSPAAVPDATATLIKRSNQHSPSGSTVPFARSLQVRLPLLLLDDSITTTQVEIGSKECVLKCDAHKDSTQQQALSLCGWLSSNETKEGFVTSKSCTLRLGTERLSLCLRQPPATTSQPGPVRR